MEYAFTFDPGFPVWLLAAIAVALAIPVVWGLWNGVRGSLLRLLALAILVLALFNPSLLVEEREALKSVVAIVTDRSSSQELDGRSEQADNVRAALVARLGQLERFEIREIEAGDLISRTTDVSTALFQALQSGLRDVPPDRLGGAVLITDGQVHDIPGDPASIGISAPIHALITGNEEERDRRISIIEAPRFGVVGEPYEISYRVDETGFGAPRPVRVEILLDGETLTIEEVLPGERYIFTGEVSHGGRNIIELRAETDEGELTGVNNRVFTVLNGIRENLRVLLVSGEPHAGERTWRNLLKSDASVDLVHFTILRPPEKQDGTPISQLSLIAFPTRELFIEKIDEFDLIIFDRYSRRGVLPVLYFDNIARYVREGGAVLVAAGPEFGSNSSIAATPLQTVLPAMPNGIIFEEPFKPRVSEAGLRHPVTRGLEGSRGEEPEWSRWFRTVGVNPPEAEAVMQGADGEPLLLLQRYEEGRVALLLSDHAWLWARGFEGGGPHVQLLRRISHWLMKEPELEEERLTADALGGTVTVTRQTLGDDPGIARLTGPSGETLEAVLEPEGEAAEGRYTASFEAGEIGLYQVANGDLTTLVHVGAPNPLEYGEVISTTAKLGPVLEATGGSVQRISGNGSDIPRLLPVRPGGDATGNGWIGFTNTGATALKGVDRVSLFTGFLGLALMILALAGMWAREGR